MEPDEINFKNNIMKKIIYGVVLLLCFSVLSASCNKEETGSSSIVGTWNLASIDVYFDNNFIETVIDLDDADSGPRLHYTYYIWGITQYFIDFQYIFKSNGIVTLYGNEMKYEVKGTDIYFNGKKDDEFSYKDGILSITRTDDDDIKGYIAADGREFGFDNGTHHIVELIGKYIKQ